MSLTDEYEGIIERVKSRRPVREKYNPRFGADVEFCLKTTGHCTNTSGCDDCSIYRSIMAGREYDSHMKGE